MPMNEYLIGNMSNDRIVERMAEEAFRASGFMLNRGHSVPGGMLPRYYATFGSESRIRYDRVEVVHDQGWLFHNFLEHYIYAAYNDIIADTCIILQDSVVPNTGVGRIANFKGRL